MPTPQNRPWCLLGRTCTPCLASRLPLYVTLAPFAWCNSPLPHAEVNFLDAFILLLTIHGLVHRLQVGFLVYRGDFPTRIFRSDTNHSFSRPPYLLRGYHIWTWTSFCAFMRDGPCPDLGTNHHFKLGVRNRIGAFVGLLR